MILVDEKKLGNALKACLSDSEFPLERRQAVLRAIRKEEKVVKKKISAALVFAIVLTLVVGGAALAANLGVFGQSVNEPAERAERRTAGKAGKCFCNIQRYAGGASAGADREGSAKDRL